MSNKEKEMMSAFKMAYREENILMALFNGRDTLTIKTDGGYYKVEYNNGNCEITYIG